MPTDPTNAILLQRIDRHEDLALFRVAYKDHDVPEFEPGQFVTLGLPDLTPPDPSKPVRPGRGPKLIRRAYSIASPSTQRDALEFYVVRVKKGKLTEPLWDIPVGGDLFMNPKIGGHFTLDGMSAGRTLVMVGTGTGLAPFRSMYLTYRSTGRWDRFVLLDGCRLARDLGYRDEMEAAAAADSHFVYLPTVTRESEDSAWAGRRGRVNALLEPVAFEKTVGVPLDPATCSVFLCGNPQMIDQVEADLNGRGFVTKDRKHPEGTLVFERYW